MADGSRLDGGVILRLAPDFRIERAEAAITPPPAIAARIAEIWQAEQARRSGSLFDGKVLALVSATADAIQVTPSSYSVILAARRDRQVREALGIDPLGVTSVLSCRDGVVIGRRSPLLGMSPGEWEVMPAGGLESTDAAGQLRKEFEEELGLSPDLITRLEARALVRIPDKGVANIIFSIHANCDAATINQSFAASGSDEHTEILVAPRVGLYERLISSSDDVHNLAMRLYLEATDYSL
ncbi:NUDIX domain-containing protein [Lacibacterium aquatile]|uniref:NUDIX domain-containing protein n=1 Tax=Lacibacterium aquatile TaxID=1168082 RepID=A0ABW5DLW8_9PROT